MHSTRPLILGFHQNKKGFKTYADAIYAACVHIHSFAPCFVPCVAMFISGPRNTRLNISEADARAIGAREPVPVCGVGPVPCAILFHASYMDIIGGMHEDPTERIERIAHICELARADVVFHVGPYIFQRAPAIFAELARIFNGTARAFLETMPYDESFGDHASLASVPGSANVGWCIDTAHIWAAGIDISTQARAELWLDALPRDRPIAIHLNDSEDPLGTHRDHHTTLGDGEIWANHDGYVAILKWAREHGAPVILERTTDPREESAKDLSLIMRKLN